MKTFFIIFLVLLLIGPLWLLITGQVDLNNNWRTANRKSAQLTPLPSKEKEAVVQVYSAKAFGWRGLFSVHTWIATKDENARTYEVYQVIGWRNFYGSPALYIAQDVPDRYWFDQKPSIIKEIKGDEAKPIIRQIKFFAQHYSYNNYVLWPGPNSNTFVAFIARKVPALGLEMPSNAVGKDFVPLQQIITKAPSGTGYQLSLLGLFGVIIAKEEGIEINILGVTFGIDPLQYGIKLPGIGEIKLRH